MAATTAPTAPAMIPIINITTKRFCSHVTSHLCRLWSFLTYDGFSQFQVHIPTLRLLPEAYQLLGRLAVLPIHLAGLIFGAPPSQSTEVSSWCDLGLTRSSRKKVHKI
jgi:hypothetical protein